MDQLILYSEYKGDYETEILAIDLDLELTGKNLYVLFNYIKDFLFETYDKKYREPLKWEGYSQNDPVGKYTFTYEEFDKMMDKVLEWKTYYLSEELVAPPESGGYLYPTSIKAILRSTGGVSLSSIVSQNKITI